MDGCEIRCRGDALLSHKLLDLGALDGLREPDHEDEPADCAVPQGKGGQLNSGDSSQESSVTLGGRAAQAEDLVDTTQLNAAKSAGDVGKTIVETDLGVM